MVPTYQFACVMLVVQICILQMASSSPNYPKRIMTKQYSWELDEVATRKYSTQSSKFPISPNELIAKAKNVIDKQFGIDDESVLAEEFVFQFPIIGPLGKQEFINTTKGFQLKTIFPDQNLGVYDFRVDPFEPNRVWFTAVFQGTNSADSIFGKATGKVVISPPQSNSFIFNDKGKVIKYTGGYVMDKELGNSGGLGGIFGLLYGIGKPFPFPEAQPYKKSWQFKLFQTVAPILQKFGPKAAK